MSTEYEYIPANMCYNAEHKTNFAELDMDTMKAMVSAAKPSDVHDVAHGWADLYHQLVGGTAAEGNGGSGGIKKIFTAAVEEVLQDWEGKAADQFRAEAQKIAKKISDGAEYARYTSIAMKNAATILGKIKPEVEAMEKPSALSSAWDSATDLDRDDSGLRRDLADGNKTTQEALDANRDDLSKGKEAQLDMAVKMEQLGAAYASQSKSMGTWNKHLDERSDAYPGEPGGSAPVPLLMPPGSSGTSPAARAPGASGVKGGFSPSGMSNPRTAGINGGIGTAPKPGAGVGTGLNGISGGTGTSTGIGAGGSFGKGVLGGGSKVSGSGGIGAASPGLPGAAGGIAGGLARGGAGAGSRTGRPGMPGTGGGPGGGANGAKGAKGRGSGLARQKGGVFGAAKGKAGAGPQGGSGLHRSRGGAKAGMAGAPGSRGANSNEEKERGQRPDYLVEDEETWTPERNVAPRVIE
ncbi:hypothetical protein [Streptomyces meridianus]|uniref:PPE family domain-containing protein n=1 Tax=Streptomyces meridianus TaxID=2938945 RepID=A0ABT0XBK9_9ACTN|nr:hypothetical protein [Streptomyces meridianus]MCM2579912.1 hypothetical protein [Streptomyces meridianus]